VAGVNEGTIETVQHIFFRPYFRVYTNPDLVGVELGVALKNCIAIAAGVCDGLGYGDNTKAALVTRGLAEIARLGCGHGARRIRSPVSRESAILVVTCLSRHSRNRYVGEKIGQGLKLEEVLAEWSWWPRVFAPRVRPSPSAGVTMWSCRSQKAFIIFCSRTGIRARRSTSS